MKTCLKVLPAQIKGCPGICPGFHMGGGIFIVLSLICSPQFYFWKIHRTKFSYDDVASVRFIKVFLYLKPLTIKE